MKIFQAFVLMLAVGMAGHAQPADSLWSRLYGGTGNDICNAVKLTTDGGYILAGRTLYSATDLDAWLVKTDSNGNIGWTRMTGGVLSEEAYDVVQRSDGGYALAGATESYGGGSFDFFFARITAGGAPQNFNYWGGSAGDYCLSLQQTSDGGYVLGGYTNSYGAGSSDFWLIKTDSTGSNHWSHTYGGSQSDVCLEVLQMSDGGYALAGHTWSFGSGQCDLWLVRTNSSGQSLWSRTYGGSGVETCGAMAETSDGGYVLAGNTRYDMYSTANVYLVKTDAYGTTQWSRTYGGPSTEHCKSIVQTPDGGYVLGGYTFSFGSGYIDMWLLRVSSTGDSLWSRTFGGSNWEECNSVQQTTDGGFVLGGFTQSFGATGQDMWLVRTGPDPALSAPTWQIVPLILALYPNYPNPFNATTTLSFDLPGAAQVNLRIYDILGREAATLVSDARPAGHHSVVWNATTFPSGPYFARLESDAFTQTRKLLLVK